MVHHGLGDTNIQTFLFLTYVTCIEFFLRYRISGFSRVTNRKRIKHENNFRNILGLILIKLK